MPELGVDVGVDGRVGACGFEEQFIESAVVGGEEALGPDMSSLWDRLPTTSAVRYRCAMSCARQGRADDGRPSW